MITFISCSLKAQDVETRFVNYKKEVTPKKDAYYYQKFIWNNQSKKGCLVKTYRMNDILISKIKYKDYDKNLKVDSSIRYRNNGKKAWVTIYSKSNKEKKHISYHFNGSTEVMKDFNTDGLTYKSIKYDTATSAAGLGKVISYGNAVLIDSVLIEKTFTATDSSLKHKSISNLQLDGKLELKKSTSYYSDGGVYYDTYFSNNTFGYSSPDSLYNFFENGNLKRKEYYSKELRDSSVCFDIAGERIKFTPLFQDAEFPQGENAMMNWLANHISYPRTARDKGIEGTVYIDFVICTDGSLCEFEVNKGVDKSIDNEVLRVIKKMPNWTPAKSDGDPVRSHFTLPIQFTSD